MQCSAVAGVSTVMSRSHTPWAAPAESSVATPTYTHPAVSTDGTCDGANRQGLPSRSTPAAAASYRREVAPAGAPVDISVDRAAANVALDDHAREGAKVNGSAHTGLPR